MTPRDRAINSAHIAAWLAAMTYAAAIPSAFIGVVTTLTIASVWYTLRHTDEGALPRWAINTLTLLATVRGAYAILQTYEEPVTAVGEVLVWLVLIRMLEEKSLRNIAQLLIMAAMLAVAASLTGVTLQVGAMLLVFLVYYMRSLMQYQFFAAQHRSGRYKGANGSGGSLAPKATTARKAKRARRPLVLTSSKLSDLASTHLAACLLIGVGAVVVFVVMPRGTGRSTFGDWTGSPPAGQSVTGFNDHVQLGAQGTLQSSPNIVAEVRITNSGVPARAGDTYYLRGAVLDRYNPEQGVWFQSKPTEILNNTKSYFTQLNRSDDGLIVQEVTLRAKAQPQLFSVLYPKMIASPDHDPWHGRSYDINPLTGEISDDRAAGRFRYTVISDPEHVLEEQFSQPKKRIEIASSESEHSASAQTDEQGDTASTAAETETEDALTQTQRTVIFEPLQPYYAPQHEDGGGVFVGTRIENTARQLLDRAGIDRPFELRHSERDRAAASLFLDYLHRRYDYTVEMVAPPGDTDPIEYFLYQTRAGHCEYFASAMAAMLRSVGISARVVTGYVATEFDEAGQRFRIREAHAHAWVEVELSLGRWTTYDPSPPDGLMVVHQPPSGLWGAVRRVRDRIESAWINNVIAYDDQRQVELLSRSGINVQAGQPLERSAFRALRSLEPTQVTALFAFAAGLVLISAGIRKPIGSRIAQVLAYMRARRSFYASFTGPDAHQRAHQARFYLELQHELRKHNLERPSWQHPRDHADELGVHTASSTQLRRDLRAVTDLYYRARFAQEMLSQAQVTQAEEALARVKVALQSQAGTPMHEAA